MYRMQSLRKFRVLAMDKDLRELDGDEERYAASEVKDNKKENQ